MDLDPARVARVLAESPRTFDALDGALVRLEHDPVLTSHPTAVWLLLGLANHLPRQRWVGEVVRSVGGDLAAIGARGYLAHPRPAAGPVRGSPGWRYELHGRGCCLASRDGTLLDVDFIGGGCDAVDPHFYRTWLETAARPGVAEARLWRMAPLDHHWFAFVPTLREQGWIEQGTSHLRPTPRGLAAAVVLRPMVEPIWDPGVTAPAAAHLAAALGDWTFAREIVEAVEVAGPELARIELGRRRELADPLRRMLAEPETRPTGVLEALADLGRDVAEPDLLEILRRGTDPGTQAALAIVASWHDPRHEPLLMSLLPRFRQEVAEYVLRTRTPDTLSTRTRAELLRALAGDGREGEGAMAFLSWLLDPGGGTGRLVAALDHEIPMARAEAAAGLALAGEPRQVGSDDDEWIELAVFEAAARWEALTWRWRR